MIKLIVEDYCQNCPLFEATVTKLTAYVSTFLRFRCQGQILSLFFLTSVNS